MRSQEESNDSFILLFLPLSRVYTECCVQHRELFLWIEKKKQQECIRTRRCEVGLIYGPGVYKFADWTKAVGSLRHRRRIKKILK